MTNEKNAKPISALSCPRCGAPLVIQNGNEGICQYCGMKTKIELPNVTPSVELEISDSVINNAALRKKIRGRIIFGSMIAVVAIAIAVIAPRLDYEKIAYQAFIAWNKSVSTKNPDKDSVKASLQQIFGKKYKSISKEEFDQIKYFKIYSERASENNWEYVCKYSFEDYKDYDSFDEFKKTIQETRMDDQYVSWSRDLTMLTGLTCYEEGDELMSERFFNQDAPVTCLIGDMNLDLIIDNFDETQIEVLDISTMAYTLEGIEQFESLKELRLHGRMSEMESIDGLEQCKKLEKLSLSGLGNVVDFTPLYDLPELQELEIESYEIKSIAFVSAMPQLKKLIIANGEINDFKPLQKATQLEYLSVEGVTDYSVFKNMTNLHSLVVTFDDDVTGMETLANLPNLDTLTLHTKDLFPSEEADLSFIADLKQIQTLKLIGRDYASNLKAYQGGDCIFQMDTLKHLYIADVMMVVGDEEIQDNGALEALVMTDVKVVSKDNKENTKLSFISHLKGLKQLVIKGCGGQDQYYEEEPYFIFVESEES